MFKFSSFHGFALKLSKLDTPVWQTGQSDFFSLAKFGHQHRLTTVPIINSITQAKKGIKKKSSLVIPEKNHLQVST
jgi:hypothetical protein